MEVPTDNSTNEISIDSLPRTGEGVVIDIGTGDGLFVYQSARQNPNKFYIGIDANTSPLRKVSEKIYRKPAKGGAPNVLFIQAAVEELPSELDGIAEEVHIHFPWGSLLRAVASGDVGVLNNIRRLCATEALVEVVLGLDPSRDATEIERLELAPISLEFIDRVLSPLYRMAGLPISERGILPASEWPEFKTSWAKRLKGNETRSITYLIAKAS